MSRNLQTAHVLLSQLQSVQPLKAEDQQRLDKKFRLEFSYNSNHLEGNTLTYSETKLLLLFGETLGNHTKRELDEMEAHDVAWRLVEEWANNEEHELSERDIRSLNEIILVKPFWKDSQTPDGQSTRRLIKVGSYKEQPNSVLLQNGEAFHYTSPTDTPMKMGDLIAWYRSEEAGELHPVERAALLHYRFVRIHPFDDGNGRISRLLMNYALLKSGYPPVIIKTEGKQDYLRALHRADVGELDAFVDYVAGQAIWSLELSLKAAKGESVDEPSDFEKRVARLKKQQNAPEAVVMKYGEEALQIVLENLKILFRRWEEKMNTVDPFVLSRRMVLDCNYNSILEARNAADLIDTFLGDGEAKKIRDDWEPLPKNLDFAVMVQMKKEHDAVNAAHLFLDFSDNSYEIEVCDKLFKRFYYGLENGPSEKEVLEIVEQLSNFMLTQLEEHL